VTPTAHWLGNAEWSNPIIKDPLAIRDGMALVGGAIVSGLEWDEQSIEHDPMR
jgi:hypothetical protein